MSLQWDGGPGCGFTPARPRVPVVEDGDFGCRRVNPEDQCHDPGSLLNWMDAVRCQWRGSAVLTVHNFADRPAKADLDLDADREVGVAELFADQRYPRPDVAAGSVPVDGYGYRWFRFRG